MRKEDAISIVVTLLVGIAAGFYLYISEFASIVANLTTPSENSTPELVLVGEAYGGCRSACPSFQVVTDGSYRYRYTPAAGAAPIVRDGRLPHDLRRQVRDVLTSSGLQPQSRVITPSFCQSYTDGIDIRYSVTLEDEQFRLDSCGTNVDADSALWRTLDAVWAHFELGGNNS